MIAISIIARQLLIVWTTAVCYGQVVRMVPYSSIRWSVYKNAFIGQSQGDTYFYGNQSMFRICHANGWKVISDVCIYDRRMTEGDGTIKHSWIYTVDTIHPKDKRIRKWLIRGEYYLQFDKPKNQYYNPTTNLSIMLLGDKTDDYLDINIGFRFNQFPPKSGIVVTPISVKRPNYCDMPWTIADPKTGDESVIPCPIGVCSELPGEAVQTENLPN